MIVLSLASWVLVELNVGLVTSSPVGQLQGGRFEFPVPHLLSALVSLESGRIGVAPKWYGLGRSGIHVVSGNVQ